IVGVFLIVFAYLRPNNSVSKRAEAVNDIEAALDQFAEELEDGNKELINSIQGLKRELEAEINKLNGRITVLENQSSIAVKLLDSHHEHARVTDHQVTERVIKKPKIRRVVKKLNDQAGHTVNIINKEETLA